MQVAALLDTEKNPNPDKLFVFHREVDKVRQQVIGKK